MIKQEVCSKDTVKKYVNLLKGSGDIIVEKDKRQNNKTHHLILNDKSDFNQIDEELSNMKRVVDKLPEDIEKPVKPRKGNTWIPDTEMVMFQLQTLLYRTSMISLESESQILYKKIIKLMLGVTIKQIRARKKQSAPELS
jgi:hypothetical protein